MQRLPCSLTLARSRRYRRILATSEGDRMSALTDDLRHAGRMARRHPGFSAMVVAALLILRGQARDVADAEAMLKAKRPLVSMNSRQRDYIRRATL